MSTSTPTNGDDSFIIPVCLACGDPFTPDGLTSGVLPILFSCGQTVCSECAEAAALSLPSYAHKWACGLCFKGSSDGGAVNTGLITMIQCIAEGPPSQPVTRPKATKKRGRSAKKSANPSRDFSPLSGEAAACVSSTLADLERVNTARTAMRDQFHASKTAFIADVDQVLSGILSHRDRVIGDASRLFDERDKALGAQAEELTVKVSLLRQAVDVCKVIVLSGRQDEAHAYESVQKSVTGLTSAPFGGLAVPPVAWVSVDVLRALQTLQDMCLVHDGVCALTCELSGAGVVGFTRYDGGAAENVFTLVCEDGNGNPASAVDPRDVSVTVSSTARPAVLCKVVALPSDSAGVFTWSYGVVGEYPFAADLDVRVYGSRVARCPLLVPRVMFPGSTVLSTLAANKMIQVFTALNSWIPGAGKPVLLFRMTRDGTATSDFHNRCDDRESTITLVRSANGFVFGGYAYEPWSSYDIDIACATAFIFTLTNPHGIPPTQYYPVHPNDAMQGLEEFGPVFGADALIVGNHDRNLTTGITPFRRYTDTTGKGPATFTGASDMFGSFATAEMEVWNVPIPFVSDYE